MTEARTIGTRDMKLLYAPLLSLKPEEDDLLKAFIAKGWNVHRWESARKAIDFNPDLVYVHAGSIANNELQWVKNSTDALWTQWTGDCRDDLLEPVMMGKRIYDLTFLATAGGQGRKYQRALKHPVYRLEHAVADWQFKEVRNDVERIVFVGNNYTHLRGGKEREEINKFLSFQLDDFAVYGNGWNSGYYSHAGILPFEETPFMYNSAIAGLGHNNYQNIRGYHSNRPLGILAAGTVLLMRKFKGIKDYFQDGENCLVYKTKEEALDLIKELKSNPARRMELAAKGQLLASMDHTYIFRVLEYEKIIKEYI